MSPILSEEQTEEHIGKMKGDGKKRKVFINGTFQPCATRDQRPVKIRILIGPKSNHGARGVSAPLRTCRIRLVKSSYISLHSSALRLFTSPTLTQESYLLEHHFLSNRDGTPTKLLLECFHEWVGFGSE
ncbi:hypothetical protein CDAR_46471 [Caerostris darwini]|uniref:Uncharacterized protein n=1 Tax=Caerostris darwini TaxID=1538125 RepID=A0AAV4RZP3_9ARAC|nr:hypothetical protein CDAR_46471 [Caerostris darwini]